MDWGGEKVGRVQLGTSCSAPDVRISGAGEEQRGDEIRHRMEEMARLTPALEGNGNHVKGLVGCARDTQLRYGSPATSTDQSQCCCHPSSPMRPALLVPPQGLTAQPAGNNFLFFFSFAKGVMLC